MFKIKLLHALVYALFHNIFKISYKPLISI